MVTFAELRDAKPDLFQAVADDLLAAGKDSEEAANAIHANGIRELEDSWRDQLGGTVRESLAHAADKFDVMAILNRSASTSLDTLQDAVALAQRELTSAISYATGNSLIVDESGAVNLPPEVADADLERLRNVQSEAQAMIRDAVEAATQADGTAASTLHSLVVDPDSEKEDDARTLQAAAVGASLDMLRDTLPHGQPPAAVERWWKGLSAEQQSALEKAVPLDLYDLPGVPASVKEQLESKENGYNRIDFLRYTRDHMNDTSIDLFNNNCAAFVSNGLLHAGLDEKGLTTFGDNNWGRSLAGDLGLTGSIPFIGKQLQGATHTDSWMSADAQREFFQRNGSPTIPVDDARPGDVAYWDYADGPGGGTPDQPHTDGQSHHAAVVTGVLPDGEVVYTQHTPGATNYSLQGRLPVNEQDEGNQSVVVVRPKQTW